VQYRKLGTTGLDVSPIAIGAMTYGEPDRGHPVWSLGEDDARPLIKYALDAGINFFDTANMYSNGSSEEILGRALKDFGDRDDVVIATKLRHPMRPGPNGRGLSRKAIMTEIDCSLRRLGTDYVDLYQIHRNDHATPLEETLEALNDLVKVGKVRYLGASSMPAWEFAKALHLQTRHGWARFVTMQNHYNLLAREEEREMIPLCIDEGVGTIAGRRGRQPRDRRRGRPNRAGARRDPRDGRTRMATTPAGRDRTACGCRHGQPHRRRDRLPGYRADRRRDPLPAGALHPAIRLPGCLRRGRARSDPGTHPRDGTEVMVRSGAARVAAVVGPPEVV
jgi:aryl-alcohol dehydrogenase-like predicted oxidoreductase